MHTLKFGQHDDASVKNSGLILLIGIVLLLAAPVVALVPRFTPPAGGCPCPQGLQVTTPFGAVGLVIGIVGLAFASYGATQRRRGIVAEASIHRRDHWGEGGAVAGVVTLAASLVLSQIEFRGPGWSIVLYASQADYLGTVAVGLLLFSGFAYVTREKVSALLLAGGVLLCAMSLFLTDLLYSDFALRCAPDVGCNPILANSVVSEMIEFGFLLAAGAFILALGIVIALRTRGKSEVTKPHGLSEAPSQ